jgi:ribosomal-protein-serine acetyltransferase
MISLLRFRSKNMINPKVVLNDGKVMLRSYEKRDIEETYKAVRESLTEMMPWLPFTHKDYSIKETRAWIKQRPKEWKAGEAYELAVFSAADGAYLGGCGINRIDYGDWCANLGYWIRSTRSGNGFTPAAARLLAGWGFRELGLKRIEIVVATGNLRSQRVAEKVGAVREGIERNRITVGNKVYDAVMFSLIPTDFK